MHQLWKGISMVYKFERITFNEITKNAVINSFKESRKVDDNLVSAYLARRSLDYLAGYSLSPVLWRKMPGSRSAGRVQSVAVRLIYEKEIEIEQFEPEKCSLMRFCDTFDCCMFLKEAKSSLWMT